MPTTTENKDIGMNIRIKTWQYEAIRKHCFKNNLKMGAYLGDLAMKDIKKPKNAALPTNNK